MTSRVSSGHWLFRDLRSAFAVLGCAVVTAMLLIFLFPHRLRLPSEGVAQLRAQAPASNLNEFGIDRHYSGVIITSSAYNDQCRELVFDNRKGTMWDNGKITCPIVQLQSRDNHSITNNATRFEEVGKAFRHEGN
jgi:hypothetical protein